MATTKSAAPKVSRPAMMSYGVPASLRGAIPWARAEKTLADSHNYWVTTVHPSGRPGSTAVWGLWLDGKFWFSCAPSSRKAKNLSVNPACTITTERADHAVIIEGTAAPVRGRAKLAPFIRAYKKKYDWDMDPENDGYFAVTPVKGFAFIEHADEFAGAATRYDFGARRPAARKKATASRR